MATNIDDILMEFVHRGDRIMRQIRSGNISENEAGEILDLLGALAESEKRQFVLLFFARHVPTVPPPPPDAPVEHITIEPERDYTGQGPLEETEVFETGPATPAGPKPAGSQKRATEYSLVDDKAANHGDNHGGLPVARLSDDTSKERRLINVRSLRKPQG